MKASFSELSSFPILTLPLMMFGTNGTQHHEPNQPVKERFIQSYTSYKTGAKKGEKKPVYDWRIKTHKRKVLTGYDGVYTRGKNKGQPKPIFETKDVPIPSTGFFPSVNHIYMSAGFRGGGGRRLKPIAENHLLLWRSLTEEWKKQSNWTTQQAPSKVAVDLFFYLPNKQSDTHNAKKLLLDAIEGVIHENDFYILDRTLDFSIDEQNPRVDLIIYSPINLTPLPMK